MIIDLFHGHDGFVLLQVSRAGHLATRRDACYYFVSTYCMQSLCNPQAGVLVQLDMPFTECHLLVELST